MADAPEVHNQHSTLEAVEHHPELSAKDAPGSPYSTLESTYWQSPDLEKNSQGFAANGTSAKPVPQEYSTLESLSYDPNETEKGTTGLAAESTASDTANWKRRKLCGIPLLFLVVGCVVIVAVVGAVVGGVVGSKSKSDAKAAEVQNGSVISTLLVTTTASNTIADPLTATEAKGSGLSQAAPTTSTGADLSTATSSSIAAPSAVSAMVDDFPFEYFKMNERPAGSSTGTYLEGSRDTTSDDQGVYIGDPSNANYQKWTAVLLPDDSQSQKLIEMYNGKIRGLYRLYNGFGRTRCLGIDEMVYNTISPGRMDIPLKFQSEDADNVSQIWFVQNSTRGVDIRGLKLHNAMLGFDWSVGGIGKTPPVGSLLKNVLENEAWWFLERTGMQR